MKKFILIPVLALFYNCTPIPLKKGGVEKIDFVPVNIITGSNLTPINVLPLLEKSSDLIKEIDSNAIIEIQKINLDQDNGLEIIVKLLDSKKWIYKYYFLDNRNDSLLYTADLVYCCEALVDTIAPIIDTAHKIIWVQERIWGSEIEGSMQVGLKLKNGLLDTVATLPEYFYEGMIINNTQNDYWGELHREDVLITDSLITLKILCNINQRVPKNSGFSNNIFSRRFTFHLYFDSLQSKYTCTEKIKGLDMPPLWPSAIIEYVEKIEGINILR